MGGIIKTMTTAKASQAVAEKAGDALGYWSGEPKWSVAT